MPEPLVQVRNLHKSFPIKKGILVERTVDQVDAVIDVSFDIGKGETLGLVGESGSGKSTTGYCILQIIRPTSGTVVFDGHELTELKGEDLRRLRRRMQLVFQDPFASLDPRMRVGDILEEGLLTLHPGMTPRQRRDRIEGLIDRVGLHADMLQRHPHEFSGGQRQRVAIARALAVQPRLIVCDEPTSALDVSVQAQILNLLRELQAEMGMAYLFITHNIAVVDYLAHEVAVMKAGRIVEHGPVDEVLRRPRHEYTRELLSAVLAA